MLPPSMGIRQIFVTVAHQIFFSNVVVQFLAYQVIPNSKLVLLNFNSFVRIFPALQIFSTFMLRFLAATRQVREACVHVHLRS